LATNLSPAAREECGGPVQAETDRAKQKYDFSSSELVIQNLQSPRFLYKIEMGMHPIL
jgi:hypothetical protein